MVAKRKVFMESYFSEACIKAFANILQKMMDLIPRLKNGKKRLI